MTTTETNTYQKLTAAQKAAKRVADLQDKLKQARKLAKDKSIAEKTSARKAARTIENRKKVLLGAHMLEKHPTYVQSAEFASWLTRDDERALFGLPALSAKAT